MLANLIVIIILFHIYVYQIILLYILSLYHVCICQFYLNKVGEKKNRLVNTTTKNLK